MSARGVLALWIAERPDPQARAEWLRDLVALRAAGRVLVLLDLRGESASLSESLIEDEQRLLDALEREQVVAQRVSGPELRAALRASASVIVLADDGRRGQPPLLRVTDAWLAGSSDAALPAALRQAGQVLRNASR